MKLELEGREVVRHTNAVSLLVSLGYMFDGFAWKETDPVVSVATERKTDNLAAEPDTATLLNADEFSIGSPPKVADAHLQADIEYLRQRVSTLEEAHRWAFGAGKGTSDDTAVFQEKFNRGIDQALRRAIEPGGVLYGRLK